MTDGLHRRGFLGLARRAAILLSGLPGLAAATTWGAPEDAAAEPATTGVPVHPEFPAQHPDRVREIVTVSHSNLDRVRELVHQSPALARAAWDWGFGDWESALGAASHMGRSDIAGLLIEHGARPDLFAHAMLGHLDVVRAAVEAWPGIQQMHGPHGITLMQHARRGAEAAAVVAFLELVGGADVPATSLEVGDARRAGYVGRYVFGEAADDALEVLVNRGGRLAIRRGRGSSRVLHRVEDHGFAPGGAPDVRIRFRMVDGAAVALTVHDPHPLVTARRVTRPTAER